MNHYRYFFGTALPGIRFGITSAKTLVPQILYFFKMINEKSCDYLFIVIPKNNPNHRTRNSYNIPQFNIKYNFFKNSFFPSVIAEWKKLDSDIWNLNSLNLLKSRILKFIRPNPNSIFHCHNPKAIKYLSRIRFDLRHLPEHKFKHSFQDTLNPICACRSDIEKPCHYLISCPYLWCETKYSPEQHKTSLP